MLFEYLKLKITFCLRRFFHLDFGPVFVRVPLVGLCQNFLEIALVARYCLMRVAFVLPWERQFAFWVVPAPTFAFLFGSGQTAFSFA